MRRKTTLYQPHTCTSSFFAKGLLGVLSLWLLTAMGASAATYTVNTTSDDTNPGSLRWAIEQANATPGADVINFQFSAPTTLTLTSALPHITEALEIDGGSGFNVTVDGGNRSFEGLVIMADQCAIKGMVLKNFSVGVMVNHPTLASAFVTGTQLLGNVISDNLTGIQTQWAKQTRIAGNKIGTNVQGTATMSGTWIQKLGILVSHGSELQVGGSRLQTELPNIISGNKEWGIQIISDNPSLPIRIEGNYIGSDGTGNTLIGNGPGIGGGIYVSSPDNVTIGGDVADLGNILPLYNKTTQIHIENSGLVSDLLNPATQGIVVKNNFIGGFADGVSMPALGGGDGMKIISSEKVFVENNQFATRSGWAIRMKDCGHTPSQTGVVIRSNLFNATDETGMTTIRNTNAMNGITIESLSNYTTIGGDMPKFANTFTRLGQAIDIAGAAGVNNYIRINRFHGNNIPIDLDATHAVKEATTTGAEGTGPVGAIVDLYYNSTENPGAPTHRFQGYEYIASCVVGSNGRWKHEGPLHPCKTVASVFHGHGGCSRGFAGKRVNEVEVEFDNLRKPCQGASDGMIQATVRGGMPPHRYEWLERDGNGWRPRPTTSDTCTRIQDLRENHYALVTHSSAGCRDTARNILECPCAPEHNCWCSNKLVPHILSNDPWTCNGGGNGPAIMCHLQCEDGTMGKACLNADPATLPWANPPISYRWVYAGGSQLAPNTVLQRGGSCLNTLLGPGNHTLNVIIKDATGWEGVVRGTFHIDEEDVCPAADVNVRCRKVSATITQGRIGTLTYMVQEILKNGNRVLHSQGPIPGANIEIDLPGRPSTRTTGVYVFTILDRNNNIATEQTIRLGIGASAPAITRACQNTPGKACIAVPHFPARRGVNSPGMRCKWSNGEEESVTNLRWEASPRFCKELPAGSHSIRITTEDGCDTTIRFTIPGSQFDVTVTPGPAHCDASNGRARVATDATHPCYQWFEACANTEYWTCNRLLPFPSPRTLAPGTYRVMVRDRFGCKDMREVTIGSVPRPEVTVQQENATCVRTGRAEVSTTGGEAPYTYRWCNGHTGPVQENLRPGNYRVTVRDALGCEVVRTITISGPPAVSDVTLRMGFKTANCVQNGIMSVSASGSTGPFTYQWSNGATTAQVVNVPAGTYTVVVTDANGCTTTGSVTMESAHSTVTINGTNATCGLNGSATAVVAGAPGPYTYAWSNGATTESVRNLAPGTYSVAVTNSRGCVANAEVTITGSERVRVTGTYNICSGEATTEVTGGTAPYTYNWCFGATTERVTIRRTGGFIIRVTDANGCIARDTVWIRNVNNLAMTVEGHDGNCGAAGWAAARVTGGTAPYTYAWSNGGTAVEAGRLSAGSYSVTVTDANGCSVSGGTTIQTSPAVSAHVNSTSAICTRRGSAEVVVEGGTGPYTYRWCNGSTSSALESLNPGHYMVTVTDSRGCTARSEVNITRTETAPIQVSLVATAAGCSTGGSVNSTVVGGTAPYSYAWSNQATSAHISSVGVGSYTLNVTDANGCTGQAVSSVTRNDQACCVYVTRPRTCHDNNTTTIRTTVARNRPFRTEVRNIAVNIYYDPKFIEPTGQVATDRSKTGGVPQEVITEVVEPGNLYVELSSEALFTGEGDLMDIEFRPIYPSNENTTFGCGTVRQAPTPRCNHPRTGGPDRGDGENCGRSSTLVRSSANKTAVSTEPIQFNVYPNPTHDWVKIHANHTTDAIVEIFDINGALVKTARFDAQDELTVSLVGLASGTYLVKAHDANVIKTHKLIVD